MIVTNKYHRYVIFHSGQDQCVIQGPIDEVRKVKENIEKLFAAGKICDLLPLVPYLKYFCRPKLDTDDGEATI